MDRRSGYQGWCRSRNVEKSDVDVVEVGVEVEVGGMRLVEVGAKLQVFVGEVGVWEEQRKTE